MSTDLCMQLAVENFESVSLPVGELTNEKHDDATLVPQYAGSDTTGISSVQAVELVSVSLGGVISHDNEVLDDVNASKQALRKKVIYSVEPPGATFLCADKTK
jgi:hypothetical protein